MWRLRKMGWRVPQEGDCEHVWISCTDDNGVVLDPPCSVCPKCGIEKEEVHPHVVISPTQKA